jgi:hypothetical protein
MHNCVFSYVHRVAEGHEYVYRVQTPVRGTLSIRKQDRLWAPGEFVEVCNTIVPEDVRERVFHELFRSPRTSGMGSNPMPRSSPEGER